MTVYLDITRKMLHNQCLYRYYLVYSYQFHEYCRWIDWKEWLWYKSDGINCMHRITKIKAKNKVLMIMMITLLLFMKIELFRGPLMMPLFFDDCYSTSLARLYCYSTLFILNFKNRQKFAPTWVRTRDLQVNSLALYLLSYRSFQNAWVVTSTRELATFQCES